MYKIDLTHPYYFHQMKKVEAVEIVKVQNKPKKYRFKLFVNLSFLFVAYVFALASIVYYFSN